MERSDSKDSLAGAGGEAGGFEDADLEDDEPPSVLKPPRYAVVDVACSRPGCGKRFTSQQGRGAHERHCTVDLDAAIA